MWTVSSCCVVWSLWLPSCRSRYTTSVRQCRFRLVSDSDILYAVRLAFCTGNASTCFLSRPVYSTYVHMDLKLWDLYQVLFLHSAIGSHGMDILYGISEKECYCLQGLLFSVLDLQGVFSSSRNCFFEFPLSHITAEPEIHQTVPELFHIPIVEDCNCPVCTNSFHFVSFF